MNLIKTLKIVTSKWNVNYASFFSIASTGHLRDNNLNLFKGFRVKQYKLNHVHNIFYKKCPSYLHNNFKKLVDIHCYNTRGSFAKFHVPNVNSFNSTSFYYNGIIELNHLPDSIKAIENKHRFKKEVKRQLFKNMTEKENSIYVI